MAHDIHCSAPAHSLQCPGVNVGYNWCTLYNERLEHDAKEMAYKRCRECRAAIKKGTHCYRSNKEEDQKNETKGTSKLVER